MLTTISQRKVANIVEQLSYYPSYCHLGSILDAYRCRSLDCTRSTGIAKPHRSILSRMCTALSSFMADMRVNFNASSLSVLRLTLDHVQASSLVEHTIVLSPRLTAKSLIQPEGPHASMTRGPPVTRLRHSQSRHVANKVEIELFKILAKILLQVTDSTFGIGWFQRWTSTKFL